MPTTDKPSAEKRPLVRQEALDYAVRNMLQISYDDSDDSVRRAALLVQEYADQRVREDRKKAAALFRTIAEGEGNVFTKLCLSQCADDLERGEHDKQAG